MNRKRDSLVPIAEALADLPGTVQAIREARGSATLSGTKTVKKEILVGNEVS